MIDVPFAAVLPIASEGHPTAAPSPSLCGSARRVLWRAEKKRKAATLAI